MCVTFQQRTSSPPRSFCPICCHQEICSQKWNISPAPEAAHACSVGLGCAQHQLGNSKFNFVNVLIRGIENILNVPTDFKVFLICLVGFGFCFFFIVFIIHPRLTFCVTPSGIFPFWRGYTIFFVVLEPLSAFTYLTPFLWSLISSISYFAHVTLSLVTIVFPHGSSHWTTKEAVNLLYL